MECTFSIFKLNQKIRLVKFSGIKILLNVSYQTSCEKNVPKINFILYNLFNNLVKGFFELKIEKTKYFFKLLKSR